MPAPIAPPGEGSPSQLSAFQPQPLFPSVLLFPRRILLFCDSPKYEGRARWESEAGGIQMVPSALLPKLIKYPQGGDGTVGTTGEKGGRAATAKYPSSSPYCVALRAASQHHFSSGEPQQFACCPLASDTAPIKPILHRVPLLAF